MLPINGTKAAGAVAFVALFGAAGLVAGSAVADTGHRSETAASQASTHAPAGAKRQDAAHRNANSLKSVQTAKKAAKKAARDARKAAHTTGKPTAKPTQAATGKPTAKPTQAATGKPTAKPTQAATGKPTAKPTQAATGKPTTQPERQDAAHISDRGAEQRNDRATQGGSASEKAKKTA